VTRWQILGKQPGLANPDYPNAHTDNALLGSYPARHPVPLHQRLMVKSSIRLRYAGVAVAMLVGVAALQGCAALGTAPSTGASTTSLPPSSAQVASSPAAPASAVSAPASRPTAPATPAGKPPPFAEVTKDAQRIDGPLPMWRKDEKVWIELAPAAFDQPLLMSPKLKSGIGEASIFGGLMASPVGGAGGPQVIAFKRVHNQVQMLALNLDVTAAAGTPQARAVEAAFSPSLLGSAAVASQPDPQSGAVLVEANGLFLSDLLGLGMRLQRSFRQGYSLDARNSAIMSVRATPQAMVIETRNHYYTASLATPWEVDTRDAILLIEEVGEPPYRIDRMLRQLLAAGKLAHLAGLGVGQLVGCEDARYPEPGALEVIGEVARALSLPLVVDLPFGHVKHNRAWPEGARATIDADRGEVRILERGVV